MSSVRKSVNSSRFTRTKFLAVFMSVLLVLTMFNMSAFATGDGSDEGTATTSEEAVGGVQQAESTTAAQTQTTPASYVVTFETQDSFVEVLEQNLAGTIVNMPAGADLVFKAFANTDYTDPVVTASSSAHPTVPIEKEGDTYTIDSTYITDDSLKISVASTPVTNTTEDANEAQPITGTEDNGASEEQTSSEIQGANNEVTLRGGVSTFGGSDLSSNGSKTVSLTILDETPETLDGVSTIVKPSGETVKVRFSVLSSGLDAVVIAIPKNPNAVIGLEQGDSRITIGTVSTQDLLDAGVAVDTSYDEYFILTSNRSTSGTGDVIQFPTITFTFTNGTTPLGAIQPIEAYSFDGVIDATNEILPGSGIAISATPNLDKQPASDATVIKADVEEISLGKTIREIVDGNMSAPGLDTTLDSRPFDDSASSTYAISYTLSLDTTRNQEEYGRMKIDGDFLIYDKLDNFRLGGTPTSITVKGPQGETINVVTPAGGKTDTSWEYYFKAALDANGMVESGDYTVTVTYLKDDYTDKYTQTTDLLGTRQIITNSAWMNYSTQDGTTVNTSDKAESVQNAIGYKQLAPDSIELKVQKKLQVKSGTYNYDTVRQSMYPEDSADELKVVTFTLTPQAGGEGTEVITGKINANGVASLVGLKPNTTYTLTETQGIENFTSMSSQTVVVGALVNDKVTITINGVDYYGGTFEATNVAQLDGTIETTVTKQDNSLTSGNLGQYTSAANVVVELYEGDTSGSPISTGTTDATGKVKFENLDPTKTYVLKATTSLSSTLTPNEATVLPSDFDATTKDAAASIQYTSTYGAIKIAKNFITATGEYANTASNLSATYRLVDKNASNYPNSYKTITLKAGGEITNATLYNMTIPAGDYELYEYSVTGGTTSTQYVVDSAQKIADITITGGVFDTYNQVLTNTSTYGQLKIQNFDYGNTGLAHTGFKYTVTYEENGVTYYVNASGVASTSVTQISMSSSQAEIDISVPSGRTYTVTQVVTPDGFELVESSSTTVAVTQNTAAAGHAVTGTAPSFTVAGGTQAVGFVNATLPDAEGTKVNVATNSSGGNDTISGATFAVYKYNGSEYVYYGTVQSGQNGKISLTNLSEGEYRLIETEAPQGFSLPAYAQSLASKVSVKSDLTAAEGQQAPKVVVDKTDYSTTTDKNTVYVDTTGTLNSLTDKTMIANAPLVTPEIQMVNASDGGKVTGGVFGLYSGSQLIGTATSDSSGFVRFTSDGTAEGTVIAVGEGTYTIKQIDMTEDASGYVMRSDAVVTITVNAQGEVTSSDFTSGDAYAKSEVNGAQVIFSNAKKPSIKIYKLGETNVFDTDGNRISKPITGAVFTFTDANTGDGLIVDDGKYTGDQGTATEMTTSRGYTGVSGLDPEGTYNVTEISVPDVEGTELGRQIETSIPQVEFEFTYKDGEITGYQIKGQSQDGSTDPVWVENLTLTINNPAEDSYQIQITKYGLGTNNGSLDLTDPEVSGPYEDGVNAKFVIQKWDGTQWVTVETVTTGTSEIDNTGKLNLALSSSLPAGTYRIVEIQSGIYSPSIEDGNSLYEVTSSGDPTTITDWTKLSAEVVTVTTPEGEDVTGLVWPEIITLGQGGTHDDPDDPYNVIMGNDDERSSGAPWYGDYVVRLHGIKKAINRDLEADGSVTDTVTGDISNVQFEVYFGWAEENADGGYDLVDPDNLTQLSNVVSGSVLDGKGDFITEYVTFKAWDGNSVTPGYDETQAPTANAVPCFVLVELGPVPAHIVKPTDETKTTILPFNIPTLGSEDGGGYYTISADDILPTDSQASGGAVIKNFEAEGLLQINKYSSVDKDVDKDDRTALEEGIFYVYQAVQVYDENDKPIKDEYTLGTLMAVVDLSTGINEVELLAGYYYVQEVSAPDGYNLNGWWQYKGGSKNEFVSGELIGPIEVKEIDTQSEENDAEVMNVFDAPYAQLNLSNYWNAEQVTGLDATYNVTYSGAYATQWSNYSHLTSGGAADVVAGTLTVNVADKDIKTLYNLPDGVYTITETNISDANTYHKNDKSSTHGVKVTISNGEVTDTISTEAITVSDDGVLWRSIDNEFDTAGTDNPEKDNIMREDTAKDDENPIATTTVKVNHLSKSGLAIKMGYIDEVNTAQDNKHKIATATFTIEGTGTNSAFNKVVTWQTGTGTANLLTVPLDPGVYKVTQTAVTSSDASITYSLIDNKTAWVKIGTSGTLTYLQNNTADYSKTKVSSEASPLQPVKTNTSTTPFFYNKINAGKLVIYKTNGTTKQALSGAAFTVKNQSDVTYPVNTISGGTHTYNSIPAEQGGSGTTYTITESTTPTNFYVDGSVVSTIVKPNQVNEVTVENVPFTSINIHKDAQMPSYVDINGNQVDGATHVVEGLVVNLYKQTGTGETLVGTKTTDAYGNLTFTNLDVGNYRVEEPSTVNGAANLSYLDFDKTPLYNESNTSYHFEVSYTASATNAEKKVELTASAGVTYNSETNTISILNHYNDDTIFIPVMKIDADSTETSIIPVEGAVFRLADADGNALRVADNSAVNYATTNADGLAYFHFLPSDIKKADNPTETYVGDYYVKEINATDAYVISPYISDYLKLSVFESDSQTANLIVFENEKKADKPVLEVEKTVVATPENPLTQAGFDAEYTISPSFKDNKANELPLINYTVADKGFVFQDANAAPISDSRLTYTINEVTVGKSTTSENQTIYASLDQGVTWKEVSSADATFDVNLTGAATNPATSLFEVWYATKSGNTYERVVGAGFDPGDITVKVSFNQFVMAQNAATSNDVAKIVNTVTVDAQHPTSKEETGWENLDTAQDSAEVTLPSLPTMSIKKELVSNAGEVRRGAEVKYRVTLTNDSSRDIVNPAIIEHPEPITYGTSQSDDSVRVKVVNGKPSLNKVEFSGQTKDLSTLVYQSYAWDNGATAAWVFADTLEAGESISIEFTVTIDSVVMADTITNTAYGTSLLDYNDLSKVPTYYSQDNSTGALFKPTDPAQVADNYAAINAITGLNGGIYIKTSLTDGLEKQQSLIPQKQISTDGIHWVSDGIDVLPGQSYYYRLQVQWDEVEGGLDLNNINIYEVIPQEGVLGTTWTDDLISLLRFSELSVSGHDNNGDYRTFTEGSDYEIYYFTGTSYEAIAGSTAADATAQNFTSFRVKMDDSYVLSPKQAVTIVYKVDIPQVSDDGSTDFSYEELAANARQDGISRFTTEYGIKGSGMETPLRSNTVTAHLLAPTTDLIGTVWDDQNRNGVLEDEATQANRQYSRNTLDLADVKVVLKKQEYNSDQGAYGDFIEVVQATLANGLLKSDGTYSFEGLESSYGDNAPNYKVEFEYDQGTANYQRPQTHQFSAETAFVNGGSTSSNSHVINKGANATNTGIVGDTGSIRLLHGDIATNTAHVVNAGINAIPYTVTYAYTGNVPAPANATPLPATKTYIYEDAVVVAEKATAPKSGYNFVGWSHTDFSMPPENVSITGSWVAAGDTPYTVRYFLEKADGSGYDEDNDAGYVEYGETNTEATAVIKNFENFYYSKEVTGDQYRGNINGDGSTELRVYYKRNTFDVSYAYTGSIPTGAPVEPSVVEYRVGQTVTVANNPTLGGYTFSGWLGNDSNKTTAGNTFEMPARNIQVKGSWSANPVTPTNPTSPDTPGTIPAGPLAPVITPIVEILESAASGALQSESTIDDDGTPLGHGAWCWVHWYILLGIIITAVYSAAVIIRRRKFVRDLQEYENGVMGKKEESNFGVSGSSTQGQGA